MLNEIAKHLEGSVNVYDFADAITVVRLKMTRDMYLEELDLLNYKKSWTEAQDEDYFMLLKDVEALDRVIGFYDFTDGEDEGDE